MATNEKVSEYYSLSKTYLESAELLLREKKLEPALFNAIHALELSIKSALYTISEEDITIHRVGGLFGKYFRDKVGDKVCKEINIILSKYNIPRYPTTDEITYTEVKKVLEIVRKIVRETVPFLTK